MRPSLTSEELAGRPPSAERYKLHVRVGILSESGQAHGAVEDMSISGARIENIQAPPPTGTKLRLGFSFYAHALPVPIHGRVVRHTETGGFAVEFEDVDFRTQILLRALLPKVSSEDRPFSDRIHIAADGLIELALPKVLLETCRKAAEARDMGLDEWILEQLESATLEDAG
jgi:hypothetical protein